VKNPKDACFDEVSVAGLELTDDVLIAGGCRQKETSSCTSKASQPS
jgi:hypothetical protein